MHWSVLQQDCQREAYGQIKIQCHNISLNMHESASFWVNISEAENITSYLASVDYNDVPVGQKCCICECVLDVLQVAKLSGAEHDRFSALLYMRQR
jgi:hypothetical protein